MTSFNHSDIVIMGGGRVVRWCWVNFQCRGVLQFGYSRARAYCARSRCGWGLFGHFSLLYPFSPLSPSLWETVRYRLKYCLKGPLNPKQPTNQHCNYGQYQYPTSHLQRPLLKGLSSDIICTTIRYRHAITLC